MNFVRGDTFLISRYITDENDSIIMLDKDLDELTFTLRESINEAVILEKKLSQDDIQIEEDGKYIITIFSDDTESMDFKTYGYDIEMRIGRNEEHPFVRTVESGFLTLEPKDYSRPTEV